MQESIPSRTALRVALRRAAHQLYDARPLVFEDPIAVPILGPHAAELDRTPGLNPNLKARPFSIGLRAFLVARSRYAEDQLAQAVARGISQYVLLGAGLDTFAHRNPHPELRVFEVDHPATQQWKRELLITTKLPHPANLIYVPVDFENQSLPEQLSAAGHNATLPTFFTWLGVVPYLTLEAFRGTLSFIAAQPPSSGVVFDYGQPRHVLPLLERLAADSLADRVKLAGEPFRLFFTPREAAAELAAFYDLEDLGSAELNSLYFSNRTDKLRMLGSAGRMLSAWV
jgi:methyltransferase (TIGR00027 family)